jgi:DNA-binding response OmpR family regulator
MCEQISGGQSLPTSTVLLIEADPSLRRLMLLGLSHSGMRVVEVSSVQELSGLDTQALDLLVVDVDQGVKSDWSQLSTLREQAHMATLPIVALSWENYARPAPGLFSHRSTASCLPVGDLTCLSKPFDARTLHSTIAKLLAQQAAQKAAQVAMVEAQVLASYERHAAPSIWPIVTAAGLLLVVTGLLLHFLVALVGVVLTLTSLLIWTLGTRPASSVSSSTVSGILPAAVKLL